MAEKRKPSFDPEVEEPKEEKDEGGKDLPPKIEESEEKETEEKEETEEGKEEETKDENIEEKDIPVRKSVQQHIIARQKKTIKKLRSKDDEGTEVTEAEAPEDNNDLSPEAQTAVKREVRKAVDPLMDQLVKKTDDDELQELFGTDPNSKKYEKRIKSYMKSSDWKGVPPSAIYHHLAFEDAEASGVKRKKAADTESKLNKGGGRQLRPKAGDTGDIPSAEDQENMTDEEFEGLEHKVLKGDFTNK